MHMTTDEPEEGFCGRVFAAKRAHYCVRPRGHLGDHENAFYRWPEPDRGCVGCGEQDPEQLRAMRGRHVHPDWIGRDVCADCWRGCPFEQLWPVAGAAGRSP